MSGLDLIVTVDGGEHARVPLRDGDDAFNREAERGALDRAYEAKESNPGSVVAIVLDWEITCPECEAGAMTFDDHVFVCGECGYETSEVRP